MTQVKNIGFETLESGRTAAIYICSHLLDPEKLELFPDKFVLDGKEFIIGEFEPESDWWKNERCNFDQCAESISDFLRLAVQDQHDTKFDFTNRYEYYDLN